MRGRLPFPPRCRYRKNCFPSRGAVTHIVHDIHRFIRVNTAVPHKAQFGERVSTVISVVGREKQTSVVAEQRVVYDIGDLCAARHRLERRMLRQRRGTGGSRKLTRCTYSTRASGERHGKEDKDQNSHGLHFQLCRLPFLCLWLYYKSDGSLTEVSLRSSVYTLGLYVICNPAVSRISRPQSASCSSPRW